MTTDEWSAIRIPVLDADVPGLVLFVVFMVVLLTVSAALLWQGTRRHGRRPR